MPRRRHNSCKKITIITAATPRAGDGATASISPRPARPIITIPAGRTRMATTIAAVCSTTSSSCSGGTAFGGGEYVRDGGDETRTRLRHRQTARRKGVPIEKKSGHGKCVYEIA